MVASGEGVVTSIWHTYGIIDRYLPAVAPAMRAARQQHGEVGFRTLNALHVPIALLSLLAVPFVIWFALRHGPHEHLVRAGALDDPRPKAENERHRQGGGRSRSLDRKSVV